MRLCRTGLAVALLAVAASCSNPDRGTAHRITPQYDPKSGRLTLLTYDSNGNGVIDTWSYMDGARVVRIDIDTDEDGMIDRWEYYGPDQRLEKVGLSTRHDGVEDAWQFLNRDGSLARVEISLRRDRTVTRIEHYDHGHLIRAEEADAQDGRINKWETYDGDRLASVAFDTKHRGTPDRRLVYGAAGRVRVEQEP